MKTNLKTIGGFILIGLGIWGLFAWGGLASLFAYLFAFIMLAVGYQMWRGADSLLKRIASGLVMAAGAALILYWLPQLLNMLLSAALIYGGWRLLRSGQSISFRTFRF